MPCVRLTGFLLGLISVAAVWIVPGGSVSALASSSYLTPKGQVSVASHTIDVRTTTGQRLQLRLTAQHGDVGIELARVSNSWNEAHSWDFTVLPGMQFRESAGKGWIRASMSDMHRYGSVDLRLKQTQDWTAAACASGTAASAPVRIVGTLFFRTRSGGALPWGQLGSASKPLTIDAHGRMSADHGCTPGGAKQGTNPCVSGLDWNQRMLVGGYFSFAGHQISEIDTLNFHVLPHTQMDGMRFDVVSAIVPRPTMTSSGSGVTLQVTAPANSTRVTGSAVLSATGGGKQQSQPCGSQGQTNVDTSWTKATLTNGDDPLTLHPDLGKALVAHEGGGATVDQITVEDAQPSPSPSPSATDSPSPSATPTP